MIDVSALIRALTAHGLSSAQIADVVEQSSVVQRAGRRNLPALKFVPTEWAPSAAHEAKRVTLGMTAQRMAEEADLFREHEFKDAKVNWDLAFHRWLRTSAARKGNGNGSNPTNAHTQKRDRMLSGVMALVDRRNRWGSVD